MEAAAEPDGRVYSATYSNVPVYEIIIGRTHVMRKRATDWVNATHILIVAEFDKAARTKILEREVQRGQHEKVQGGYGKFQGTWIPLEVGRELAQKYGVFNILAPIFDFVPGDQSPPPAPRQTTTRPRAPRASAARGEVDSSQAEPIQPPSSQPHHEASSVSASQGAARGGRKRAMKAPLRDQEMVDVPVDPELTDQAVSSEGADDTQLAATQALEESQQRDRLVLETTSPISASQGGNNLFWGDELLDHLMVFRDADPDVELGPHPEPPQGFHPDWPVDDSGRTALHWGAAWADMNLVLDFMRRGADIGALSQLDETPLVFASQFVNSYRRRTMPQLMDLLGTTISQVDKLGFTALHHAATLTTQPNLAPAGRYYIDTILAHLSQTPHDQYLGRLLDYQTVHGDTALIIAARQGDQAIVRALVTHGASTRIRNESGKSADDYLRERRARAQQRQDPDVEMTTPPDEVPDNPMAAAEAGVNLDQQPTHAQNHVNGKFNPPPNTTTMPSSSDVSKPVGESDAIFAFTMQRLREAVRREMARFEADQAELRAAVARLEEEQAQIRARRTARQQENQNKSSEAESAKTLAATEEELAELLKQLDARDLARQMQHAPRSGQAGLPPPAAPDEEGRLRTAVEEQEQRRRRLLLEVVQKTAVAGSRERSAQYKRIIAGCLNLSEDDVQALAPAILEHLEAELERKSAAAAPSTTTAAAYSTAAGPLNASPSAGGT